LDSIPNSHHDHCEIARLICPPDSRKGEIRLLTISTKNHETEQIDVRISTAGLRDAGKYFALSYTWGDPKNRREISLNGLPFSVTSNLFEALQSIQTRLSKSELEGHKVWVDSLHLSRSIPKQMLQKLEVCTSVL
jgi:hypothetical protein